MPFLTQGRVESILKTCLPLCFRHLRKSMETLILGRMHSYSSQASRCLVVNNIVCFGINGSQGLFCLPHMLYYLTFLGQSENDLKFHGWEPLHTSRKSNYMLIKEMEPPGYTLAEFTASRFHISWNVILSVKNSQDGETSWDSTTVHFVFTQELPLQILICWLLISPLSQLC